MHSTNVKAVPQIALPQLDIVEGLHHGVRLALEETDYSVGVNAESDIVLRDEGVLPNHARLRLDGVELRVEATGGEVIVGKSRIEAGHGCRVRLPVRISIGKAALHIVPGAGASGAFSSVKAVAEKAAGHPAGVAGGVLVCAVAALVIA